MHAPPEHAELLVAVADELTRVREGIDHVEALVSRLVRRAPAEDRAEALTEAQALDALAEDMPPFAILDVNLGHETSFPIAKALQGAGVPFAFGTGFGDSAAFPDRFKDAPVLQKPYSAEALAGLF